MRLGPTLFAAYLCIGAADWDDDVDLRVDARRARKRKRTRKQIRQIHLSSNTTNPPHAMYVLDNSNREGTTTISENALCSASAQTTIALKPQPSLSTLPAELILLILQSLALLAGSRALAPAIRTSRTFRALGRPLLYAHLDLSFITPRSAARSIKLLHTLLRDADPRPAAASVVSLDSCAWNDRDGGESGEGGRARPQLTSAVLQLLARAVSRMPKLKALACDRKLPFWVWRNASTNLTSLEIDLAPSWTPEFSAWLADRPGIHSFRFTTPAGTFAPHSLLSLLQCPDACDARYNREVVLPRLGALTAVLDPELAHLVCGRPVVQATFIPLGSCEEVANAAGAVARAFADNESEGGSEKVKELRIAHETAGLHSLDILGEHAKVAAALAEFAAVVRSVEKVVLCWEEASTTGRSDEGTVSGMLEALCRFSELEEIVFLTSVRSAKPKSTAGSNARTSASATNCEPTQVLVHPGWSIAETVQRTKATLLSSCPRLRQIDVRGVCVFVRGDDGFLRVD